jgi:hypothetical protein
MRALVTADTKKDYMSSLDMFGITKVKMLCWSSCEGKIRQFSLVLAEDFMPDACFCRSVRGATCATAVDLLADQCVGILWRRFRM